MANWTSQLTSELEEVKEITHKNHGGGPGIWKNDADVHHCPICEKEFTISRRKVLQYRVSNTRLKRDIHSVIQRNSRQ